MFPWLQNFIDYKTQLNVSLITKFDWLQNTTVYLKSSLKYFITGNVMSVKLSVYWLFITTALCVPSSLKWILPFRAYRNHIIDIYS
jgi:hypothetical protein